jgi:hypothetical protein
MADEEGLPITMITMGRNLPAFLINRKGQTVVPDVYAGLPRMAGPADPV